jgi:hypothetical protein
MVARGDTNKMKNVANLIISACFEVINRIILDACFVLNTPIK